MPQANGFTLLYRLLLSNQHQMKWWTTCLSSVHLNFQVQTSCNTISTVLHAFIESMLLLPTSRLFFFYLVWATNKERSIIFSPSEKIRKEATSLKIYKVTVLEYQTHLLVVTYFNSNKPWLFLRSCFFFKSSIDQSSGIDRQVGVTWIGVWTKQWWKITA